MKSYPAAIDGLVVEHDGGVLAVRFDRPDRRNALTDDMVLGLIDIVDAASSDESVRVIHITGTGEHFCPFVWRADPATDALAHQSPRADDAAVSDADRRLGDRSAVNIALLVVAADDARGAFVDSAFTPDSGGSWLIPRLVGIARAKEMIRSRRPATNSTTARSSPCRALWPTVAGLAKQRVSTIGVEPPAEGLASNVEPVRGREQSCSREPLQASPRLASSTTPAQHWTADLTGSPLDRS